MAVDPNLADAQQVAATVLICLGEHEEALRYVRRCLRLTPGLPDFYLICNAEALIGLGRFAEAQAVVQRILARRPEWLMAHGLAAIAYGAAGAHEAARAAVTRLRALNARFTVPLWRSFLFYPDREDVPGFCTLLASAGLPA